MSRRLAIVLYSALVVFGAAAGYGGWRMYQSAGAQVCDACRRPIHAENRTDGFMDGRAMTFCCPTCALTAHRQTGKPVRVTRLTDATTHEALAPDGAWIVEGGDENLCMRGHAMMAEHKQPMVMEFDRCAPSMFAFAQREEAVTYQKRHGGRLVRFTDLAVEYQR